jgi:HEPN domain-containing protein
MKSRARDWLRQAESELAWGRDSFSSGHWGPVCFTSQQIAEKCLKAIALHRGAAEVRSHSLIRIASELGIDGDIEQMGRRLDAYYISARYPDAFVEGAPFEYFDREQAEEALLFAGRFIDLAQRELGEDG